MKEFDLIASFKNVLEQDFEDGLLGPGDDAASIDASFLAGNKLLVSSDMLVEGVHFRRDWSSMDEIAWKSLAVNESDIAAMGGHPLGFLISLGLPDSAIAGSENIGIELYKGFKKYLDARSLKIFGGDTVRTPVLSISVTVLGHARKPVLRSGAKSGDTVYLSREIGAAGLGLRYLQAEISLPDLVRERALIAHKCPEPETRLGKILSEAGVVSSMMDVSDGLLQDAQHICRASQVSFLLEEDLLPLCAYEGISERDKYGGLVSGDDYALLFTSPFSPDEMKAICAPFNVYPIGQVLPYNKQDLIMMILAHQVRGNEGKKTSTLSSFLAGKGLDPLILGYSH